MPPQWMFQNLLTDYFCRVWIFVHYQQITNIFSFKGILVHVIEAKSVKYDLRSKYHRCFSSCLMHKQEHGDPFQQAHRPKYYCSHWGLNSPTGHFYSIARDGRIQSTLSMWWSCLPTNFLSNILFLLAKAQTTCMKILSQISQQPQSSVSKEMKTIKQIQDCC